MRLTFKNSVLICCLLGIALFLPDVTLAVSDEAKAMVESLRQKTKGNDQFQQDTAEVPIEAPAENPKIPLSDEARCILRSNAGKDSVIKILGQPVSIEKYNRRHVYYFENATVFFEDDKVINWVPAFGKPPQSNDQPDASRSIPSTRYSDDSYSKRPRLSNGSYTTRTGPRGGKYHISASGKKVYHKRQR